MQNNRLSFSAVEKFLNCPAAYKKYYIENMREKLTGSALIFGGALDKGLNDLLENKQDYTKSYEDLMNKTNLNGKQLDLSLTDLIQYGNQDFDMDILTQVEKDLLDLYCGTWKLKDHHQQLVQLKRQGELTGEALREFNYMSWLSLKRKGLMFLEAYKEQILPNIKRVIEIQKYFSIKNEEGDEFIGYIDFIAEYKDGRIVIFDNKTTSSAYKEDSARTSKQLASYLGALQELGFNFGTQNVYVGYIAINKTVRKKKEPLVNIQVIIDKIPDQLVDSVFEDYDKVNSAIHAGQFPENYPDCSSKYGKCFCKSELIYVPKEPK